jgi:hypothetical protein
MAAGVIKVNNSRRPRQLRRYPARLSKLTDKRRVSAETHKLELSPKQSVPLNFSGQQLKAAEVAQPPSVTEHSLDVERSFSFPVNFRADYVTLDPRYLVLRWTPEFRAGD